MKTNRNFTRIACFSALLGFSGAAIAQTSYTPGTSNVPAGSGNYVTSNWAGTVFSDTPYQGSIATNNAIWGLLRGNPSSPAAPVVSNLNGGSFYSPSSGAAVAAGWGGTFSVKSTLTAGYVGDSAAYFTYADMTNYAPGIGPNASIDMSEVAGRLQTYNALAFVGSGDSTHVYDFSTMELGYLPAGSMIAVIDVESYGSTTVYEGPVSISSNVSSQFLDWTYGGNLTNNTSILQPNVVWNAATSTWTVDPGTSPPGTAAINNSSDWNVFVTTEDLTTMTVTSRVGIENSSASHSVMLLAPTVPIPEPSTLALLGLASAGLLRRRRI